MEGSIKLRVWDRSINKMVYGNRIQIDGNGTLIYTDGVVTDGVMQYTWVKDINGVEIYEGDIVKIVSEELFKRGETCVIERHRSGLPYIVQRYLHKSRKQTSDYSFDMLSIGWDKSYYEIIGNIYENSELIPKT